MVGYVLPTVHSKKAITNPKGDEENDAVINPLLETPVVLLRVYIVWNVVVAENVPLVLYPLSVAI